MPTISRPGCSARPRGGSAGAILHSSPSSSLPKMEALVLLEGVPMPVALFIQKQTLIGPTLFAPHGPTMGAFLRRKRDCTQALELQPMPQEGTLPPCQGVDPAWRSGRCEDGHWHAGRGRTRCYAKTARRHRACGGHVGIFTLRVLSFNLMIFEICRQKATDRSCFLMIQTRTGVNSDLAVPMPRLF